VTDLASDVGGPGDLDRLVRRLCEERGLDLGHYRPSYLERRIAVRLRALGLSTYREYVEALDRDRAEYPRLLHALTINVTEFFRDAEMWELLRSQVIPALLEGKRQRRGRAIRVWSAGCASGEEAYSLVMAFLEAMGEDRDRFSLSVHATDVDSEVLEAGKAGVYPTSKLEQIPADLRLRYTLPPTPDSPETFSIAPEVHRLVHFERFSLFDSPPMNLVDMIVCRNVLIYFTRAEQTHVISGLHGALAKDGYLVLGRSEKLPVESYSRFAVVDSKERIYHTVHDV